MRELEFLTGHVTFKLRYNQIYQMKTTLEKEAGAYFLSLPGHVQV